MQISSRAGDDSGAGRDLRSLGDRGAGVGVETLLHDAVLKVSKTDAECPPATPQCVGSWTRLQLQNAPSLSELRGLEAMVRLRIPLGLLLRSTLAYTWGEGPRVGGLGYGTTGVILGERVPLSRVPPLHGSAELIWQRAKL